jgi:hypothetical protein
MIHVREDLFQMFFLRDWKKVLVKNLSCMLDSFNKFWESLRGLCKANTSKSSSLFILIIALDYFLPCLSSLCSYVLKILQYISQTRYCLGYEMRKFSFSSSYYYYFICTYLSHHKFNYKFYQILISYIYLKL